jgi:hypothetical protein
MSQVRQRNVDEDAAEENWKKLAFQVLESLLFQTSFGKNARGEHWLREKDWSEAVFLVMQNFATRCLCLFFHLLCFENLWLVVERFMQTNWEK